MTYSQPLPRDPDSRQSPRFYPQPQQPYYDPLRIPPRVPTYPGVPSIGEGDLFPSGGFYPGGLPGSGGSLMGPNHPFFLGGSRGVFPYPGAPPGAPGGFPGYECTKSSHLPT